MTSKVYKNHVFGSCRQTLFCCSNLQLMCHWAFRAFRLYVIVEQSCILCPVREYMSALPPISITFLQSAAPKCGVRSAECGTFLKVRHCPQSAALKCGTKVVVFVPIDSSSLVQLEFPKCALKMRSAECAQS